MAEFGIISQYLPERNEKTEKHRIESCRLRVHFYSDICDQPHKADCFMRNYCVCIFATLHNFYLFVFIGGGGLEIDLNAIWKFLGKLIRRTHLNRCVRVVLIILIA